MIYGDDDLLRQLQRIQRSTGVCLMAYGLICAAPLVFLLVLAVLELIA